MTLQEQLNQDDMAIFVRQISRYEEETLTVQPRSAGGYWLNIKRGTGRTASNQNIACASFEELVSKLLPGEALSQEWFTL